MAWFRRKHDDDEAVAETGTEGVDDATEVDDDDDEETDAEAAAERDELAARERAREAEETRRASGPFDAAEVDDDVKRIDLGALRLPAREGMELRLEVEEKTQKVIAATVVMAGSTLQVQAFAAPRTLGVWDDVRGEIAVQVTKQGGTADEVPGTFGRELIARIPVRTSDGRTGHQASRFVGVDGPRWFVRGVFGGPASHDTEAAAPLEDLLRSCVVVRGDEAMAPRDLLPLRLPDQGRTPPAAAAGAEGAGEGAAAGAASVDELKPFERGPEITERR
jgi:hypothetical protein